jgi:hypothetical protein
VVNATDPLRSKGKLYLEKLRLQVIMMIGFSNLFIKLIYFVLI